MPSFSLNDLDRLQIQIDDLYHRVRGISAAGAELRRENASLIEHMHDRDAECDAALARAEKAEAERDSLRSHNCFNDDEVAIRITEIEAKLREANKRAEKAEAEVARMKAGEPWFPLDLDDPLLRSRTAHKSRSRR